MGHHAVLFPTDISYGSSSGWGFNHGIVQLRSGAAEYVSRHSDARHVFDVAWGVRGWSDIETIKNFYLARGGLSNSFLFQDPMDMNTSSMPYVGDGGPGTTSTSDVVIEPAGAFGQTEIQLIKRYNSGGIEHIRTIRHPVDPGGNAFKLEIEPVSGPPAVTQVEGTDFTVDYSTGIVTILSGGLALDDVVRAGFDFYERVRFGAEVDSLLSMTAERFSTTSARSPIPLIAEIQGVAHRDELDKGGGSEHTGSFSYSPSIHGTGVRLDLSAAATVTMPSAADFPLGGPYAAFSNSASGFAATFKDPDGTTLWTLASGKMCEVYIMEDTGNAWFASLSA